MLAQPAAPTTPLRRLNPPELLRSAWAFNRTLTIFTVASALLALAGAIGMVVDPRIVLGMPNWSKSTKFGISLAIYGASLLWMLPMAGRWPRLARFVGTATGALLLVEIALLVVQALRGRAMHFNVATPLDETLWSVMGTTIMLFWLVAVLGLVVMLFQRLPDRVLAWSIRLGLLVSLVGFTQGFMMPQPNATQRQMLAAGQRLDLVGAHTVGALDGGPGLPLLGWSTDHGDLRIGHFVGIHGAQVIPLLGVLLLRRRERWLREGHRVALAVLAAAGYLGLVALVTWQALRDQPLLAPDALTLGALGALIAAVGAVAAAVLLHARATSPATATARQAPS